MPETIARNVRLDNTWKSTCLRSATKLRRVIIFVADTVDPATDRRGAYDGRKSQRKLKPAMLANMHVTDTLQNLVVPDQAVVRDANRDYVFGQGNNKFVRVPVELGPEVAGMRPVLKGLIIDQDIVVEGAFHLDNERKLAELE